jgi:hypothetical protein
LKGFLGVLKINFFKQSQREFNDGTILNRIGAQVRQYFGL